MLVISTYSDYSCWRWITVCNCNFITVTMTVKALTCLSVGHYCEAGQDQKECAPGTYSSKQGKSNCALSVPRKITNPGQLTSRNAVMLFEICDPSLKISRSRYQSTKYLGSLVVLQLLFITIIYLFSSTFN